MANWASTDPEDAGTYEDYLHGLEGRREAAAQYGERLPGY